MFVLTRADARFFLSLMKPLHLLVCLLARLFILVNREIWRNGKWKIKIEIGIGIEIKEKRREEKWEEEVEVEFVEECKEKKFFASLFVGKVILVVDIVVVDVVFWLVQIGEKKQKLVGPVKNSDEHSSSWCR